MGGVRSQGSCWHLRSEVRGEYPLQPEGMVGEGLEGMGQVTGVVLEGQASAREFPVGAARGPAPLTVQGEGEGRAILAAMLAGGQVVVHGAVEAGLPVGLVEPQVKGAGDREQAGGLPDGAGGHVALCGRGRRGGGQPARPPPSPSP